MNTPQILFDNKHVVLMKMGHGNPCGASACGGGADPVLFPPEIIVAVKALVCQLPKQLGLPFSRFTHNEIARQKEKQGIVASISGKTLWR